MALAFFGTAARAEARLSEWEAALLSGSARMQLMALRPKSGPEVRQRRAELAQRLGFGAGADLWQVLHSEVSFSPILRYDGNINNGVIAERLVLGGLTFVVDAQSRARAGLVGGAGLTGSALLSFGQGGTLSLATGLRYERALRYPLSIRGAWFQACGSQHIGGMSWLGLCQVQQREKRSLDGNRAAATTLSYSQVSRNARGPAEISLELGSARSDGMPRGFVGLSLRQAIAGFGVLQLDASTERRRPGVSTADLRIRPGFTTLLRGRPVSVSLLYQKEGGSLFFGQPRRDRLLLLRADYALGERFSIALSYRHRSSSARIYQGSSLGFGVNMRPFRLKG